MNAIYIFNGFYDLQFLMQNTIHTRYFKFNLFFIGQILFDYFIRKHSNLIHGTLEGKYYNKLFCTSSMSISLISNLTAVLHEIQE